MAWRRRPIRRLGVLAITIAILAAACAPDVTPSPSSAIDPSATPGQVTETSPTPAASATPPAEGDRPPASAELITAAVESGTLDAVTGLVYRFYAQYWDPRLPEAYQGESEADHDLATEAFLAFDGLSAEDQATLRPFLLRPTDPDSYLQDRSVFGTTAATAGLIASADTAAGPPPLGLRVTATVDPRCQPGGFLRRDVPGIPVTVWSLCSESGGDTVVTPDVESRAAKVATFITDLWPGMTRLMGEPIGDEFTNPTGAGEVDEAGDGRIDIYVILSINEPYHRSRLLAVEDGTGATYPAHPRLGVPASATSSGYIVVNWAAAGPSDARQKANVAHEFFHVLQNRHNMAGKRSCPYPNVTGTCAKQAAHWFSEASAAWAEHHFVPEDDGREPDYERFDGFLTSDLSLSSTAGSNAYRSWVWPLFMEQETTSSAVIGYTWRSLEGKVGWQAFQQTVNDSWPFDARFRDFAVRVWNHDLEGDPKPYERFHALDPNFRDTRPNDEELLRLYLERAGISVPDPAPRFGDVIHLPVTRTLVTVTEPAIPELWAEYYDISPDSQVRTLRFDFSGLNPVEQLDVDMLLRIDDKWERRKYSGGPVEFCLDKAADAAEQVILVLSNHEMSPNKPIRGSWTVAPSTAGCLTVADTIVYDSTYTVGTPTDDYHRVVKEDLTIRVSLKTGADGRFEDDGSTFRASFELDETVKGLPNCDLVTETSGGGGGPFEPGGISASMVGRTLVISATVEIRVAGSTGNCAASSPIDTVQRITLPECEGEEVVGSSPRTFQFLCTHVGDWTWGIQGKVMLGV